MAVQRIAYVVNVFPKLSETFIANELAALRARSIGLSVLSLRPPTETLRHSLVQQAGLLETTVYDPKDFLRVLRQARPQLIHAHFATEPAAAAWKFAAELGVPFTFTAHGYDIHRKPPIDFCERAWAAARVITVSEANARHIQSQFGVPSERLRVIPCGVDTDLFKPVGTARGKEPLIVCVARHVPVKNLELLLHACAQLRDRGIRFQCAMIGDGPLRPQLEALRQQLELPQVVMPGAAEQRAVLGWWQKAAVGVLTSSNEGLPVCLLEASSCGVPVVATAVGGVPELVQEGVTGFCTRPGDPSALADALAALLSSPELRGRMGLAGRRRVEECFSLNQQIAALLAVWEEALIEYSKVGEVHGHCH